MFTCYLINGTIFPGRGGESRYIRCVFSFFASSVGNISNSKKNSGVYRPPCSVSLFFLYYNETLILTTDFMKKKTSCIKVHENPSSGSRIVSCGRTDTA